MAKKVRSVYYQALLPKGALFEYIVQGAYVRVSAIDPVTRIEVTVVGDASQAEKTIQQIAFRKLARAVEREIENNKKRGNGPTQKKAKISYPSGWDL